MREHGQWDEHKAHQLHHFDHDIKDPEFEVTRPRGGGRFYAFLMDFKIDLALNLLGQKIDQRHVLDICAGSGMDAELLVRRGARVVCLDIAPGALARARERSRRYGVDFVVVAGDAEQLPFAGGTFDYAFVHDGLHHLEDVRHAISEMARVSRRGLVITEPAEAWLTWLATRLHIITEREDSGNEVRRIDPSMLMPFTSSLGYPTNRFRRYLVKYQHQPGRLSRWLDWPAIYTLAKLAFNLLGVGIFGRFGNKIAFVAVKSDVN